VVRRTAAKLRHLKMVVPRPRRLLGSVPPSFCLKNATMALLTLLQISDLHIGDLVPGSAETSLDAQSLSWWQAHPLFDGYLGHTEVALSALAAFVHGELLETEKNLRVLVTGDLTASGAATQLDAALRYLTNTLASGPAKRVGLKLGSCDAKIPGNHDHWPGRPCTLSNLLCMRGAKAPADQAVFDAVFPTSPWRLPAFPLTPRCRLVLAGIDSDADVSPGALKRVFARGSFVTQCQVLSAVLGPRPPDELRVLLVHHSYLKRPYALAMDRASRRRLETLARDCGIQLILTGHAHTVEVQDTGNFWEARSGATTARDYFEPSWLLAHAQQIVRLRRLEKNALLVHRFEERDGAIMWEVCGYERKSRAGPFEETKRFLPEALWP